MNTIDRNVVEKATATGLIAITETKRITFSYSLRGGLMYTVAHMGLPEIETNSVDEAIAAYNNQPNVRLRRLSLGDRVIAQLDRWTKVEGEVVEIYQVSKPNGIEVAVVRGSISSGAGSSVLPYQENVFNTDYPVCHLSPSLSAPYLIKEA